MDFDSNHTAAEPALTGSEPPSGEPVPPPPCKNCGDLDPPNADCRCIKCGCVRHGSSLALKHGGRRSLDRPEALIAIRGKREVVIRDLGGDLTVIASDLVTDYARVDVLIESVAANIEVGGVFTAKGRARACVGMLLSLLDRRLRLAQVLGLERRVKSVRRHSSINEFLEQER